MAGTTVASAMNGLRASVKFCIAGRADEAELRALLRATPTPGAVSLRFEREPDYFAGEALAGADDRTIIARREGRLVCMGRCSTRVVYFNGAPRRVSYLGELRLAAGTERALEVLRDGYSFFSGIAEQEPAEFYFTSIATDNLRGRRVLEKGRKLGLPEYRFLTELVTLVSPVVRRGSGRVMNVESNATVAELSAFLNKHARDGQLAPTWDGACWVALARHGIGVGNFVVVRRAGEIVAAGAVWDQRAFKQTVIDGYSAGLRWARPVINLASGCAGRPGLPSPGSVFPQAAVLGLAWDDEAALRELWVSLRQRAMACGVRWLTFAADAGDEKLTQARRAMQGREYCTRLYAVRWAELPVRTGEPDGRRFRPEIALL